jgi:RimJ/RimL family protein N-acetyltransferase
MTAEVRPARREDADFLLALRNDPSIIAAGDSGQAADASWLDAMIDVIWMPVGYVRYDRDPAGTVELSIAVDPEAQGKGIGTAALEQVKHQYAKRLPLVARVKLDNKASLTAFRNAGYREEERTDTHVVFRAQAHNRRGW